MPPLLLNISNSHLFWQDREPQPIEGLHRPFLLAFPAGDETIEKAHARLVALVEGARPFSPEENPLAKAVEVHEPVRYKSFWDHGRARDVIPVVAKRSYWVPDISDSLFFEHGFYTAEHDIPYVERATADLAAERDWWMLDTKGSPARLKVLTYDIETTRFAAGAKEVPIDMVGWSDFEVEFRSSKDLETEAFDFDFIDLPNDWASRSVEQITARTPDEEVDLLERFTQHAVRYDIISGHNILGFDNKQIHDRILELLRRDRQHQTLGARTRDWFNRFTTVHSRPDRSFHFGTSQEVCTWHPISLDTFHAARKFFFYHDDFTLKGLAPWLGIEVPDRVYLQPHEMALDAQTLLYNKHDVQEQIGLTQTLLAQALPLAFTVNLSMEELLTGGNTKMWDHMALIRARRQRKIMPATCRAQGIARALHRILPRSPFPSRPEVAAAVRALDPAERASSTNKELVRVAKQGPEMPFWCEHPGVIARVGGQGDDDPTGYAIPGGMTLKPDSDLKSHFVPWFHVVAADVGAMYPTILKAQNLTADTVQPAHAGETPDDWIWLFELDSVFAESGRYVVQKASPDDPLTKGRGWLVGVRRNPDPGLVNLAMTGILSTIQKVKDARAAAKKAGRPKDEQRILDMTYQSLKAARNAGTHGILVAVNVSCRQFNVWGGANITTIGQRILNDTLIDWEGQGIRCVYGDTDGLYMGCSKSAGNVPHLAAALGVDLLPEDGKWITRPEVALAAVAGANRKWRDALHYEGFELEAETHDAMVFVVHKNYLIFDARRGKLVMETKGNNFKGSDKAPLAQHLLEAIMAKALAEVASWDDEESAREAMKAAVKRATKDVMQGVHASRAEWEELILRQSVSPVRSYEPNPDGTLRVQAVRTVALEQVLGEPITATRKFKFVVAREPLPLYKDAKAQEEAKERLARQGFKLAVKEPKNRGLKPIEYMWPVEKIDRSQVDWAWYRSMVEDYVKGAFGFESL
ncbi:MAG: 3'-5' exonuclease, partial [Thermoplasmatota archaeon]